MSTTKESKDDFRAAILSKPSRLGVLQLPKRRTIAPVIPLPRQVRVQSPAQPAKSTTPSVPQIIITSPSESQLTPANQLKVSRPSLNQDEKFGAEYYEGSGKVSKQVDIPRKVEASTRIMDKAIVATVVAGQLLVTPALKEEAMEDVASGVTHGGQAAGTHLTSVESFIRDFDMSPIEAESAAAFQAEVYAMMDYLEGNDSGVAEGFVRVW